MKILTNICIQASDQSTVREPLALTDASLLTGGKPQFLPNLEHEYRLLSGAAITLHNTGRHIAPRFVHRYCESIAVATFLVDCTEMERCRKLGLPYTRAVSFDFNVARGPQIPFSQELMDDLQVDIRTDSESPLRWATRTDAPDWRDMLSEMSSRFTFRTGDLVLPAPSLWKAVGKDTHVYLHALHNDTILSNTKYEYNIK